MKYLAKFLNYKFYYDYLDVSAPSKIAEAELFFRALYQYSESVKFTLSPCLFLNFA